MAWVYVTGQQSTVARIIPNNFSNGNKILPLKLWFFLQGYQASESFGRSSTSCTEALWFWISQSPSERRAQRGLYMLSILPRPWVNLRLNWLHNSNWCLVCRLCIIRTLNRVAYLSRQLWSGSVSGNNQGLGNAYKGAVEEYESQLPRVQVPSDRCPPLEQHI